MSIKKLFEASDKSQNYQSDTNQKDAFESVESSRNLEQLKEEQKRYIPQIDYGDPSQFARYGSARLYYKSAMNRIVDFYPYDGSDAEINKFFNECLDIENHLLETRYPRSTGYIKLASSGYAVSSVKSGYGIPTTSEYIDLKGGPGTGSAKTLALKDLVPTDKNDNYNNSNIYDKDIYKTAGMPSDYGKGTRTSNLRSNFDDGVTVEFWFKSGSIPDWRNKTKKQVIFDLWNQEAVGAAKYGRFRVELTGAFDAAGNAKPPFVVHVASGSAAANNINSASLGNTSVWSKMGAWNHYAITMQNTGSNSEIKLYVNGVLNDHITTAGRAGSKVTLPKINPLGERNLVARIGALRNRTVASADAIAGAGKLSGSLDEFRFWKVARNAKQIGENWFTQVRGGSNNDVSNATLGVYYKFNEGITGKSNTDRIVLDYAGRVTNGFWKGYSSTARQTGSAIVLSNAAIREYKDPIIRANNPKLINLSRQLEFTGSAHDYGNNTSLLSLVPGWILDQYSETQNSDLTYIAHIMGAYFDKLYLQISEIPKLRQLNYISSSYKPASFSKHLPQSLGLYSPDLFIDSTVMEKFLDRDKDSIFEQELSNTKNLIYINLYNNLTNIFKNKGTKESIKNVLRCFNIDENILRLSINSNNEEFLLRDNLRQELIKNSFANFNKRENAGAVIYQKSSSIDKASLDSTSGSIAGSSKQNPFGFTCEVNALFPFYEHRVSAFSRNRNFNKCSIFGMRTALNTEESRKGTNTVTASADVANFNVYAVKEREGSRNAYFQLESKIPDGSGGRININLTSSLFLDVYNNEPWNLSVRMVPVDGVGRRSTDAGLTTTGSAHGYEIVFTGINPTNENSFNMFTARQAIPKKRGQNFIEATKRLFVGAKRENIIGALENRSDMLVSSLTYWTKYLETSNLKQHALDFENIGISGSYESILPRTVKASGSLHQDILNKDTLALHWNFNNVTSSNSNGNFVVQDFTSGSIYKEAGAASSKGEYAGWAGRISGHQYPGYGFGFEASSKDVVDKKRINKYKFIDPEQSVSSDQVQIFSDEDVLFPNMRREEFIPNYVYSLEKSLYNAVSEEMLDFFAGVTDFHNVIGSPVNKYRMDYKEMEKLRNSFFRRVSSVANVERYINYYKWLDDSLTSIVSQLVPLSSEFIDDILNVVESHVLERNKYQTKLNNFNSELTAPEPAAAIEDMIALDSWTEAHSVLPSSPRKTNHHPNYWFKRAERTAPEISSGNPAIDQEREIFRKVINSTPTFSSSQKIKVATEKLVIYDYKPYGLRNYGKVYKISANADISENQSKNVQKQVIKGGVNFPPTKDIGYTMAAVRPAGPVNRDGNAFVPRNVLLGFTKEVVPVKNFKTSSVPKDYNKKERRVYKVHHGRDWEDGLGYSTVKSTLSFPFNIFSSSNKTGYNRFVINKAALGITITNLHNDVYGDMMEQPIQSPFTDAVVGGLQARHVDLNRGADDPKTRPEAWRILLGTCQPGTVAGGPLPSGAIGIVGPDYPPPSLRVEAGQKGYPYIPYAKAWLYRDMVAKRPVNIRNINIISPLNKRTVPGNFRHNYEVLHSFGTYTNPRQFIENQPSLPKQLKEVNSTTNVRTLLSTRRTSNNHFRFVKDYSTEYLTKSVNRTIISNRFSAPGGIETMTLGYLDFRGAEYSPYNALAFRNLGVIRPWQSPSGNISQKVGGTPSTARVFDIHGKDYGLHPHLARHTARFGRDSMHVKDGDAGATYNQLPGYHKVNRNPKQIVRITNNALTPVYEIAKPLTNTKGLSFGWGGNNDNNSESLIKSGAFSTDFPNGITMGLWIHRSYSQNNGQQRGLITIGDDFNAASMPNGAPTIALGVTTDFRPYFEVRHIGLNNGYWSIQTAISVNSWQNLAVTYDGSSVNNRPTFYLNGVSQSLSTAGTSPQQPGATMPTVTDKIPGHSRIGAIWGGSSGGGSGYAVITGSTLDEVSIYSDVLTAADISKIYCSGKVVNLTSSYAPKTSSLVTWLRLGDQVGATAPPTAAQLTASGTTNLERNFPNASKSVFFDVKGNNNFAIRSGTPGRNNMNYNANNTLTPPGGCTGQLQYYKEVPTYTSNSLQYDNWYVQHPIPRASRQYWWLDRCIENVGDLKYSGYQNTLNVDMMPYRSSSTDISGRESFYKIVSASAATINKHYQPINRLNIIIDDPVSSSINTLGYPVTQDFNRYFNNSLIGSVAAAKKGWYLNNLLSQRQATYGWTWQKFRQRDAKVFIKERKENRLTTVADAVSPIVSYFLPPASFKGRTAHVCVGMRALDYEVGMTEKTNVYRVENTNPQIYFNETDLNNLTQVDSYLLPRSLRQIMDYGTNVGKSLNWIMYTQNIFPSTRNENISRSVDRIGYDNKFWRNSQGDRITLGGTFKNSFDISVGQSAWVLDAPVNFLTRSSIIRGVSSFNKDMTKAGELQNTYYAYITAPGNNSTAQNMFPAALYARKHDLGSPASVASPQAPLAPGIFKSATKRSCSFRVPNQIDVFGGEAVWEAPSQAGILVNGKFQLSASRPWYNDYKSFDRLLKLKTRGYGIVPEFRISEHVNDYIENGVNNKNKFDTFEIPGTTFSSSQKNFYLDYSNSDFLKLVGVDSRTILQAAEIRLNCSAAIKYNPYKGFYPAQRTVDMVKQFKKSFENSIAISSRNGDYYGDRVFNNVGGLTKPLFDPLFAPGILYNTIKSGIAVDYPIISDPTKTARTQFRPPPTNMQLTKSGPNNQVLTIGNPVNTQNSANGYYNGAYWDFRVPFEAIIDPAGHMSNISFIDMESHPSMSFAKSVMPHNNKTDAVTASMSNTGDKIYSMMARNFFAGVGEFYLKGAGFTQLKSQTVATDLRFGKDDVFMARIKLRRSHNGRRLYGNSELDSFCNRSRGGMSGVNYYTDYGARATDANGNKAKTGYPIPQDPTGSAFEETFTMYSRPTAFGPSCAGRPPGASSSLSPFRRVPKDSFSGYNPAFTPPYQNGEAWIDLIFRPSSSANCDTTYDLERILSEVKTACWRFDAGYPVPLSGQQASQPTLIPVFSKVSSSTPQGVTPANDKTLPAIYDGYRINANSMQATASLSIFGVQRIFKQRYSRFGRLLDKTNETVGAKWIIQPKFETPMLNFNDKGPRSISVASGTMTMPLYASSSTPRGMWHQFGTIPHKPEVGVFMEIGDIPQDWLKNHYSVNHQASIYNNYKTSSAPGLHSKVRSLSELCGFNKDNSSKRLGELKDSYTIREAIVAVPYVLDEIPSQLTSSIPRNRDIWKTKKKFISLPKQKVRGPGSRGAGKSIRSLKKYLRKYVFPPEFDWLHNKKIDPFAMYVMEFEHTFDKDDLSYMWQNLAPRDYEKMSFANSMCAHSLNNNEMMNVEILQEPNLRWMVFKVKQRVKADYYSLIPDQAGGATSQIKNMTLKTKDYPVHFNWPYDYLSFVELIKLDVDVLLK